MIGLALIVALLVGVAVLAIASHTGAAGMAGLRPLIDARFLLGVQTVALAAGLAFAWRWIQSLYRAPFWRAIHWRKVPSSWVGRALLIGIGLSLVLQVLENYLPLPKQLPIDKLFNPRTAWAVTIYGVAVAPFFEEIIFRGLIYPSLRRSFGEGMSRQQARAWRPFLWAGAAAAALIAGLAWLRLAAAGLPATRAEAGFWAAIVFGILAAPILDGVAWVFRLLARLDRAGLLAILATGILFGLAHGSQLANALVPIALISVVGIVLTAVRAASGSVVASWVMHCAYNGTLFFLLFVGTHGYRDFHKLIH